MTPVRIQARGAERFSHTVGEDVSETGLGFINDDFIAPSTSVMMEIEVLARVLHPIGKIVWASPYPHSNKYRLGTEFIEFDSDERKFLSEYVQLSRRFHNEE